MTESNEKSKRTQEFERRQAILKDLIIRLHAGEDKEKIKQEFQEHFDNVSALEISVMERGLLTQGIEVEDIQRLCNIHASLFAGAVAYDRPVSEETEKPGHPIRVLKEENVAIESALDRIARLLEAYLDSKDPSLKEGLLKQMGILWAFDKHYARKEYAIFPIMERYGMTAPPKVMWGVDDEIRAQFKEVRKLLEADQLDSVRGKFDTLKYEMAEMIIKEEEILLPMVSDSFTEADWVEIVEASEEIGYCIVRPEAKWTPKTAPIEDVKEKAKGKEDGDVHFETGHLSIKELEGILNRLPLEITFIDAEEKVKYYNSGPEEKIFMRTKNTIDGQAENCHPAKSVKIMKQLVADLKSGKKDVEMLWYEELGKFVVVTYCAVRDDDGVFLGTLEYVQDAKSIRGLEGEKRKISE